MTPGSVTVVAMSVVNDDAVDNSGLDWRTVWLTAADFQVRADDDF